MLGQDKYRLSCACQQLGIDVPKSVLFEAERLLSAQHYAAELTAPLMVKPNNLGVSIGIDEQAKVRDLVEAAQQSLRIWTRYGSRAIVQDFISGTHIRAVYMRLDNEVSISACVHLTEVAREGIADCLGYIPFTRGDPLETYHELRVDSIDRTCRDMMVALVEKTGIDDYCAADLVVARTGRAFLIDFNACPFLDNASFGTLRSPAGADFGHALWTAICASYERQKACTTGSSRIGTLKSQK